MDMKTIEGTRSSFTGYVWSREEGVHEEIVDPFLSDRIHLRNMPTQLLHPARGGVC